MAKPTAPTVVPVNDQATLVTFLPVPRPPMPKNVPYLKSFLNETPERVIRGSKLLYTACSTKHWRAPLGEKLGVSE